MHYLLWVAAAAQQVPSAPAGDIVITAEAERATGQTVTTVDAEIYRDTPAATVADMLRLTPGVATLGGNGPRDIGVSVRGSNARSSFGARNIVVTEDGFPVTQPDGLARFDLTDPHAYAAVDVVRGPSSSRFGNYALAGAIDFRTVRGADLRGVEVGTDLGGDGYGNVHATVGDAGPGWDYAVFGSWVGGDGAAGHNQYRVGTVNALATGELGSRDRVAVKLIHSEGEFRLSTRLSLNQYRANPYQEGCARAASAAAGCGTIAVLVNGVNGARVAQTASEADLARDDRRTIIGTRWEHDLSARTSWRTQATFDSRVVFQPTNATPFRGTFNSYNLQSDLTHRAERATATLGVFHSKLENRSFSYNKTPAGRNGIGAPTQTVLGDVAHIGARARLEYELTPRLELVAGVAGERSVIDVVQTGYTYPIGRAALVTVIPAERRFWNVAPEAAIAWRAHEAVRLRARVATGYGIPQAGNLFVTAAGVAGNNSDLSAQRTTGVDLGATITLAETLTAELTGYQEWFRSELVSQSAGVNLLAYTSNVPRSVHRGVELGLAWRPVPVVQLSASYSYNDHYYTEYAERLTAGTRSLVIDRVGNAIPGVVPHVGTVRLAHDRGALGGFVELTGRSGYAVDNANLLRAPGQVLVNLNLRWQPPGARVTMFGQVQNLFDRTHVGGASVIGSSLDPVTGLQNPAAVLASVTGSIYAGQPLTAVVGLRTRF